MTSEAPAHSVATKDRFINLVLSASSAPRHVVEAEADRLEELYAEKTHHYHTIRHIDEMLSKFDVKKREIGVGNHLAVELAIWYHDCVYDAKQKEHGFSEKESIKEWIRFSDIAFPELDLFQRTVALLIECTIRHQLPSEEKIHDCSLSGSEIGHFLDFDIAIFAAPPTRYQEYAEQIRAEYIHVEEGTYCDLRPGILERFLAREGGVFFQGTSEMKETAEKNLGGEIRYLRDASLFKKYIEEPAQKRVEEKNSCN